MGRSQRALGTHALCVIVTCWMVLADGWAHGQELDRGRAATPAAVVRDLFANFDVQKLKVAGDWKLAGGVLESPIGERQRIELPGTAPQEYQLQLVVERTQGKDALGIGLVVDGRQTSILLDAYASQASGLHLINGQGCDRNVTSYKQPIFAPGKRVEVRVTVRRQEVTLFCDGKTIFTWRGDPKQLSLFEGWSVKNPQALFLAAHQSAYRVHAARLGPIEAETAVAAPKTVPAAIPAAPPTDSPPARTANPAPQTGGFELARDGVSTELYIHVMQRSGKPAYLPDIQRMQAGLEASRRSEKLKAKTAKKEEPAKAEADAKAATNTKWSVYVPQDYDGIVPYGAIAFINPTAKASVHAAYRPLLDKHRLIWISPHEAGNDADTCWRMTAALDGLRRLREDLGYALDPDRVYISGMSGGGRVASNVGLLHPDVVTGGIYFAGVNYFREAPAPGGGSLPASIQGMTPTALTLAQQRRHVLIFGKKDNVAGYVPAYAPMFLKDGFKYFHYFEVPDLAHTMPGAEWFDKAVLALDAPLAAAAKGHFDVAVAAEKRELPGRALEAYFRAAAHGGSQSFAAEAKQKAAAIKAQYAEAVAVADRVIDTGDTKSITAELTKFRRMWEPVGNDDAKRLAEKQKAARLKN